MFPEILTILSILMSVKGSEVGPRIIGGTNATQGEFPQTVSIRKGGRHVCGGTLIHSYVVLTAGQCVVSVEIGAFSVQYNTTEIVEGSNAPYVAEAAAFIRHPDFSLGPSGTVTSYINDIGLLVLKKALTFDAFVQKVKLPAAGAPTPSYNPATVVGWGYISKTATESSILQKTTIAVYTDPDCESYFANLSPTNRTINICAGLPGGGAGPCLRDQGGPLFAGDVQVGITSWFTLPCGGMGRPAVFTKVSSYVKWVDKSMKEIEKKYGAAVAQ